MASKQVMQETKKVVKGNTSVNGARYWRMLETGDEVENFHYFCMKLFESIGNQHRQTPPDEQESMYATLLLLEFNKNTKPKPQKWLDDTHRIRQQHKPKEFEHAKWVVRTFLMPGQQAQFPLNFISSVSHIPGKWNWNIEPGQQLSETLKQAKDYWEMLEQKRQDKVYKRLYHISYPPPVKQSKITSYAYSCFTDYFRSNSLFPRRNVWAHTLDCLRGLAHALRFTGQADPYIAPFLHLISNMLKFNGCSFEDLLKELIYIVHGLRSCPGLNGLMAQSLFNLVHGELKFPGTALRKQIKRNFINLDSKKAEDVGGKKYFLSYRRVSVTTGQFCSLNTLRKMVIHSIFGCSGVEQMDRFWLIVQPLDLETTYTLYYKIVRIIDIATGLESYESIQKLAAQSINELMNIRWIPYRKIKKDEEIELTQMIEHIHPYRFFQFPTFEIVPVKPENLLNQQADSSIFEIFEENKQYPFNQYFYSNPIDFAFYGTDDELAKVLNKICDFLLDVSPTQLQKMAFYLLPCRQGDCFLAQYLASKDIWYRRHVYNIFRQRTLSPPVSLDDPQVADTFPNYIFNKTIQMYLREAQRKIPFQVFCCDYSVAGRVQTSSVYFVTGVMLGVSVEAEEVRNELRKEKKGAYCDLMEVYLQKIKKIPAVSVNITARCKESGGEVVRQERAISVQDMQICNTPRPYFFGCPPDPTTPEIQVAILNTNLAKTFRSQVDKKDHFKRFPDEDISQAFKDLFTRMTVESIVVEKEGQNMKLLVDGLQINEVERFKVSPVYTSHKLPLTLPVKCFLPFRA